MSNSSEATIVVASLLFTLIVILLVLAITVFISGVAGYLIVYGLAAAGVVSYSNGLVLVCSAIVFIFLSLSG